MTEINIRSDYPQVVLWIDKNKQSYKGGRTHERRQAQEEERIIMVQLYLGLQNHRADIGKCPICGKRQVLLVPLNRYVTYQTEMICAECKEGIKQRIQGNYIYDFISTLKSDKPTDVGEK